MSVETEALEYYRKLVSLIYREVGSMPPENRRAKLRPVVPI